tara:strand:- start:119 stop:829 length:711 start_codon:yes stop_codon:yes gene_type:complete
MSQDITEEDLTIKPPQIVSYFTPPGGKAGMIILLILISIGLYAWEPMAGVAGVIVTALVIWGGSKKSKPATDAQIDAQWTEIAKQRVDEAYRVAHIDKEDAIRDAEYFWAYPQETQGGDDGVTYKTKEGLDKFIRRNYQRLVYMIYAKDQLVVFDENICIENNWDGNDNVREFYWTDVSSIGFDQKTNTLSIACGPQIVEFPLQGEKEDVVENFSTEAAEKLSNSIRVILRERKTA